MNVKIFLIIGISCLLFIFGCSKETPQQIEQRQDTNPVLLKQTEDDVILVRMVHAL